MDKLEEFFVKAAADINIKIGKCEVRATIRETNKAGIVIAIDTLIKELARKTEDNYENILNQMARINRLLEIDKQISTCKTKEEIDVINELLKILQK